jgi:hypothetical protein
MRNARYCLQSKDICCSCYRTDLVYKMEDNYDSCQGFEDVDGFEEEADDDKGQFQGSEGIDGGKEDSEVEGGESLKLLYLKQQVSQIKKCPLLYSFSIFQHI